MKKILLGLGSLSLALGPIAGVLSCSGDKDKDLSKVFVEEKKVNTDELIKVSKENKNVLIYLGENEPLVNYKEFLSNQLKGDEAEFIKVINEFKDSSYKIVKADSKETDNKGKIISEALKKDENKKEDKKLRVILLNKKEYVIAL